MRRWRTGMIMMRVEMTDNVNDDIADDASSLAASS